MHDENLLNSEIPEKFKDPQTGQVNIEMMARSYKALEQRMSQLPTVPKSPEEYCIECDHSLFTADTDVNKRLYEKGFTQDQAQEVYNLAEEKLIPIIRQMAADYKADREVERLIEYFGGVEKWKVVARQLYAFGNKTLSADVLDSMASSYEGVLALYRMMKGEEPNLHKDVGNNDVSGAEENELASMMRDPKYWKHKDPTHIAKVTQGFKNLYGA
ncbi:MAG: capsid assembly protein [Alphaproteobacteria bacterium]